MTDIVTPVDLAKEREHADGGRAIRNWLRKQHPEHIKFSRWELTPNQVARIHAMFRD